MRHPTPRGLSQPFRTQSAKTLNQAALIDHLLSTGQHVAFSWVANMLFVVFMWTGLSLQTRSSQSRTSRDGNTERLSVLGSLSGEGVLIICGRKLRQPLQSRLVLFEIIVKQKDVGLFPPSPEMAYPVEDLTGSHHGYVQDCTGLGSWVNWCW